MSDIEDFYRRTHMFTCSSAASGRGGRSRAMLGLVAAMAAALIATAVQAADGDERGGWKSLDGWKHIEYRLKLGEYNKIAEGYQWDIEFRNGYDKTINFSYSVNAKGKKKKPLQSRFTVEAGKTAKNFEFVNTTSPADVVVNFGDVRFGNDDTGRYHEPDNKK